VEHGPAHGGSEIKRSWSSPTLTTSSNVSFLPRRPSGSPLTDTCPVCKNAFAAAPLSISPASFSSWPSVIPGARIRTSRSIGKSYRHHRAVFSLDRV
jgi:hypothetical protein